MACMRKKEVPGSTKSIDRSNKPSLSEIKETSAFCHRKKSIKDFAHSDLKTRSKMFSDVQCPACLRKFCEKAADKHIELCIEKKKLEKFAQ